MASISMDQFVRQSPRAMMDARINTAAQAGSISTEDQDALEKALDSIDSALGVSGGSQPTSRLDPSEMKGRIDDLIQQQVTGGTLTDEQATELKDFFAEGPGGVEGAKGGMGGPGGMPPMGPPPGGCSNESSDEDDSSSETSSTTDQLDSLIAFLEKLRESVASSSGYGASTAADNSSGLIIDQVA